MLRKMLFMLILCWILNIKSFLLADDSHDFYAAVLEFSPPGTNFTTPEKIVNHNLDEYLLTIDEASKHSVQILVFPEATLNYNGITSRQGLVEFAVEIDHSKQSNCDYSNSPILNKISNRIKEAANLYVLVNVVEREKCDKTINPKCCDDGYNLYNTNLVFNKIGCVISTYRKFNLFLEPDMNTTKEVELATFTTDFGVEFGHFVCFDILFRSPAIDLVHQKKIKHFLFPSMWFSEIPFYGSTQYAAGWAYANNVVVLASGANSPSVGNTGSGIFLGKHGATELIVSPKEMRKLIISKVPKDIDEFNPMSNVNQTHIPFTPVELDEILFLHYSPPYTRGLPSLLADEHTVRICKSKICCEFSLEYKRLPIPKNKIGYDYRLAVFSGQRSYPEIRTGGELYCAIVPCINEKSDGCGQRFKKSENVVPSVKFEIIKINAVIEMEQDFQDYLVMPTTMDFNVLPLNAFNFNYTSSDIYKINGKSFQNFTIESNIEPENLLTFGIFGRNFNLDAKNANKKRDIFSISSSKFITNTSVWIAIFTLFALFYFITN